MPRARRSPWSRRTVSAGAATSWGGKLMLAFLATLPELGTNLWRIVLVNGGAELANEGHPAQE